MKCGYVVAAFVAIGVIGGAFIESRIHIFGSGSLADLRRELAEARGYAELLEEQVSEADAYFEYRTGRIEEDERRIAADRILNQRERENLDRTIESIGRADSYAGRGAEAIGEAIEITRGIGEDIGELERFFRESGGGGVADSGD